MGSIKVVSFDLDDTLWEVRPVLIMAEKKVAAYLEQVCPEIGERFSVEEINQRRLELYQSRPDLHHQISRLRRESIRLLVLECGYSEQHADQIALQAFQLFIQARHEVQYFADAEHCMRELSHRYTLVALTNGNADVRRLSIGQYFDYSIKAEDIDSSKPDPAHFELTLQRYGISAMQMLHVGDHPEHDVQAAQQLGIRTVWVNRRGDAWRWGQAPDAEVESLGTLPAVIRSVE